MDLDTQARIRQTAERLGADRVVVVLGSPDPESAEVFARTVTEGDPSYAGPLAAVSLGLPVYHILEDEIRRQVDPDVYARNVGMMELALDAPAIVERVQMSRGAAGEQP
jgi:hypothetical protein